MTADDIIELASRYVEPDELSDIPEEGDTFYFLHREIPDDKFLKDDEGWQFGGYAILNSYKMDMDAKPVGKWIFINYTSLATFPPEVREVKLQPPHIALGKFSSPDRSFETRMVRLVTEEEEDEGNDTELLQFPGKR